MRASAKHKLLVSMLFPTFLLLGCEAPTGLQPLDEAPAANKPEAEAPVGAPGLAVDEDGCFEFDGTDYCPSMGDSDRLPEVQ